MVPCLFYLRMINIASLREFAIMMAIFNDTVILPGCPKWTVLILNL